MANFDITLILEEMMAVIKQTVQRNWKDVKEVSKQFLQNRKERLALLAELRIAGDLTEKRFLSRLEDEKLMLEAELNALAILSKSTAQHAANAAISVIENAVLKALGIIL